MDLTEMTRALDEVGIAPAVVALGGRAELCWCVERSDDGRWETHWYERGSKNRRAQFESESDACFQLLGRLACTQLSAGALAVEPGLAKQLGMEGDQYMGWTGLFAPEDFDDIHVEETRGE